jgi:hypothetical protein
MNGGYVRILQGGGRGLFKTLFRHWHGEVEKNHEKRISIEIRTVYIPDTITVIYATLTCSMMMMMMMMMIG